jgi:hypothetical protein
VEKALALAPVHARIFVKLPVVFGQRDFFVAAVTQQVLGIRRQLFFAPAAELFHKECTRRQDKTLQKYT